MTVQSPRLGPPSLSTRSTDTPSLCLTSESHFAFFLLIQRFTSLTLSVFVFICPMHKQLYLFLFVMVQVWTIFIHDGDMISGSWWEKYINSPAHHTLHHLYFTCNYGQVSPFQSSFFRSLVTQVLTSPQYFTWADSYYDSYRSPEPELDPLLASIEVMKKKGLVDEHGNPIKQQKKKDQ